jgi:TolB protein
MEIVMHSTTFPEPRRVHRLLTLLVASIALGACADAPTTPGPGAAPGHAALAKSAKLDPTTAIAISINGAGGQNLFLTDTLGTRVEQLTFGGLDDYPAWSPDRRRIAFTRGDGVDTQIFVKSLNGGREVPIGTGIRATWSPDGKQLAFMKLVAGNFDIYAMNADGSNVRRLTTDPAFDGSPHWAADGSAIAFTSDRTGTSEVFVMKADGSSPTRRTFCGPSYYCVSPEFSPVAGDARIAFHLGTYSGSGVTPFSAIEIVDATGGVSVPVSGTEILGQPAWSPDAQRIAFIGTFFGQTSPQLYSVTVNGTSFNWFPPNAGATWSPAWAR